MSHACPSSADTGLDQNTRSMPVSRQSPPDPVRRDERPDHDGTPDISIVLPFRNERDNLIELLDRLQATLEAAGLSYELIFVDDGSTDDGVLVLEPRARLDHRIKVLQFSRNFGQHVAATAGIDVARGGMVCWMDSDLQERPEDIPRFIAKYREGFDVVYGVRRRRRQPRMRAWMSLLAMTVLNRLAGLDVSPNQAVMRLFSADVAAAIRRFPERKRFLGYLMPWAGYRSTNIQLEIDSRRRGKTNYSWVRLVQHVLTGLTSFSVAPLRISAVCSCLALLGCVVGVLWVLYGYFTHGYEGVSGWASLIVVLFVLHAMQFAVLAIVGEYVGLTYTEAKRRPLYFCSRTINVPFPTTSPVTSHSQIV